MTRLDQIRWQIHQTTDRKLIRLLNRAWWAEFFRVMREPEKKAA